MPDERRRERWEEIREHLAPAAEGFGPGFADRVMARIAALPASDRHRERPGSELLHTHLVHAFPRLAAACLLGVVALSLYTLLSGTGLHGSPLEALLGLPEATLETVLVLGAA